MAHKPGSIDQLPEPVLESVQQRLRDGRVTQKQIVDDLQADGHDVSRSALNRFAMRFRKVGERMRMAREIASSVTASLDELPDANLARLLVETIQTELFDLVLRLQEAGTDETDAAELADLMRTIGSTVRDLESAKKASVESELKQRHYATAVRAKLDAAIHDVAKQKGLTTETVDEIRAKVLGITRPAPAAPPDTGASS